MLRWNYDWADKAEHWEKQYRAGLKVPEPFLDRPDLLPESAFYWQAFCDLATERSVGMSVGPIPRSRAMEYGRSEGMDDLDRLHQFWEVIRAVDSENIKLLNKTSSQKEVATTEVSDTEGMKKMMQRLKERKKKQNG